MLSVNNTVEFLFIIIIIYLQLFFFFVVTNALELQIKTCDLSHDNH